MVRKEDNNIVHYDITDRTDNWTYDDFWGTWTAGANQQWDALEEHNDFDAVGDWDDTLQPATQCAHRTSEDADTRFGPQELCVPVGSKGGN